MVMSLEFYKEKNLKKVEAEGIKLEIAKDWEVVKLKKICKKIVDGTHKTPKYVEKGIRFISTQNLVPFREYFDFSQYCKYISPEEHLELTKRCKPEKGDILISKCGTIGRSQLIRVDFDFSIFVGLALLKLKKDIVYPEYLEQLLNFEPIKKYMETSSPGATRRTLTLKAISELKIPLPPLPEQQKIAQVLTSIDKAIEEVDKAIAKTERIKKGLMQELLTKGIGHKEFKDREIGRIPEEWEVVRLEEITNKIIDSPHKIPKKSDQGVPFVSVNYMIKFPDRNFYIDENKNGLEYISDDDLQDFVKRFNPEKGDILYSKWGTPGVAKLINTDRKFIGSCSVTLIKPRVDRIDSLFLVYTLNSNIIRRQIVPHSKTSTRTEIHIGHIKKIKIPLPPLKEQKKIAEILSKWDEVIELKKSKKEKLERIKKKVMELLLTGKIRVR